MAHTFKFNMKYHCCISIYNFSNLSNKTCWYSIYDMSEKTRISNNAPKNFADNSFTRPSKYLSMEADLIPHDKIWEWCNKRYLRRMFPIYTQTFLQIFLQQFIMIFNKKNKQISMILWNSCRYVYFSSTEYDYIHTNDNNHSHERKYKNRIHIFRICRYIHRITNYIF